MQELMRLAGMNFTLAQIWKVSFNCTFSMHAKVHAVIMQTCQSIKKSVEPISPIIKAVTTC